MAYRRVYAYGIMVGGVKRVGGTIHADSMEDAVRGLISREKLVIKRKRGVMRPCDGAMIPQAEWLFEGKHAYLLIWAPAEYF